MAALEKKVPAAQVRLCGVQDVATAVPTVEAEACAANVPAAQAVQLRFAVDEDAAEKKVPAGHETLWVDGQALARLAEIVDSMAFDA